MGLFSKTKKEEPMQQNKFKSVRKYKIREGFVDEMFKRLMEIYEYLNIDPDNSGFTPSMSSDLSKESGMGGAYIGTMIEEKLMVRAPNRGAGPKFKYKWNTIVPTREMAVNLIKCNYNRLHPDDNDDEVEISGMYTDRSDDVRSSNKFKETDNDSAIMVKSPLSEPEKTTLIDYSIKGDIMTVNINLKAFAVEEQKIINGLMHMLAVKGAI